MATKKTEKASSKAKSKPAAVKAEIVKPAKSRAVTKDNKGTKRPKIKLPKFLQAIGGYFKGAWEELRQVRWPNRRATWSLTLAVIVFTLLWVGIIIGLDTIYKYLFNELIL